MGFSRKAMSILICAIFIAYFVLFDPIKSSMTCSKYVCTVKNTNILNNTISTTNVKLSEVAYFDIKKEYSYYSYERHYHSFDNYNYFITTHYQNGKTEKLFKKETHIESHYKEICNKLNELLKNDNFDGYSIEL